MFSVPACTRPAQVLRNALRSSIRLNSAIRLQQRQLFQKTLVVRAATADSKNAAENNGAEESERELYDIEKRRSPDPLTAYFQQRAEEGYGQQLSIREELSLMQRIKSLQVQLGDISAAAEAEQTDDSQPTKVELLSDSDIIEIRGELLDCYCKLGQMDRAAQEQKKIIELQKDLFGPVSVEVCTSLVKLRELLKEQFGRNHVECAEVQSNIITVKSQLANDAQSISNFDMALEWYELGLIMRDMNQLDRAETNLSRALEVLQGKAYGQLSVVEQEAGDKNESDAKQAVAAADAAATADMPAESRLLYALILVNLGHLAFKQRDFVRALDAYLRATKISVADAAQTTQAKILGMPLTLEVYSNMGHCCLFVGKMDEAEHFFKQAIEQARGTGAQEQLASLLQSLGVLYGTLTQSYTTTTNTQFQKYLQQAERYTQDAVKILEQQLATPEMEQVQLSTNSLGSAMGRRKLKQLTELVQCNLTLGTLYNRVQRLPQAEQCFQAALSRLNSMVASFANSASYMGEMALATTIMPNLRKDMAFIYNNLAQIQHKRHRNEDALELYQKAKQMAKDIPDKTNPILGTICRNLGVLYVEQSNKFGHANATEEQVKERQELLDSAEQNLKESYDLFHAAYPSEYHPDLGDIASQLGKFYMKLHKWRTAIEHFEDAIDVYIVLDADKLYGEETRALENIRLLRESARGWRRDIETERRQLDAQGNAERSKRLQTHLEYIDRKLRDTQGKENLLHAQQLETEAKLKGISGKPASNTKQRLQAAQEQYI